MGEEWFTLVHRSALGFVLMLLFLVFGLFFFLLLSHLHFRWYQQLLWSLLRLGEMVGFNSCLTCLYNLQIVTTGFPDRNPNVAMGASFSAPEYSIKVADVAKVRTLNAIAKNIL